MHIYSQKSSKRNSARKS